MKAAGQPVFEDIGSPGAQEAPRNDLESLLGEFEDKYRRETTEVRTLSVQMQDIIGLTEGVLDELANRSLWLRIWHRITGHSSRLGIANFRNQLKLQQTNLLLTAAIARQNRMIVEGLRLTLDKLQRIEDDARSLRQIVVRLEERKEQRRLQRARATSLWQRTWHWLRSLFDSSHT